MNERTTTYEELNERTATYEEMCIYYESYYGAPVPLSQANQIKKQFMKMVKTIKADIENHIPQAGKSAVKAGILEALLYLQSTGDVRSPDLYLRNVNHANEAFKYAVAVTNGKPLRRDRTPQEITASLEHERQATLEALEESRRETEAEAKKLEERSPFTANLLREYHKCKRIHIENGFSTRDAKIHAYTSMLNIWEPQGGYDYYFVFWTIPHGEGIYDEQEVIDAYNNHYLNQGHYQRTAGENRMRVNGKAWGGLHHDSRTD